MTKELIWKFRRSGSDKEMEIQGGNKRSTGHMEMEDHEVTRRRKLRRSGDKEMQVQGGISTWRVLSQREMQWKWKAWLHLKRNSWRTQV